MKENSQLQIQARVTETFRRALKIEPPDPNMDLFDASGLDSLMFVTFLEALEQDFEIAIDLGKVDLAEFESVSTITSFIAGKKYRR